MLRKIARLFIIKTRFEAFAVIYALSLGAVERGKAYIAEYPGFGGKLLFLEHGLSPDTEVARWQRRIEPIWKPLMGGCHLARPVTAPVLQAGFHLENPGHRYMPGMPRWAAWMEWGVAIKPG